MKAFPIKAVNMFDDNEGMDLRDYFAAKIMQSFAMTFAQDHEWNAYEQAFIAYQIADAMIETRQEVDANRTA